MSLPMFPTLLDEEQDYVIKCVKESVDKFQKIGLGTAQFGLPMGFQMKWESK